jgi:hypothetical protein
VTVPGRSYADILTQRPDLARTVLGALPGLKALEEAESERQMTRAFGAAPSGVPREAAPAPVGAEDSQLAAIRTMRAQLDPIIQRITGTPLATTERGKAMIKQYQDLVAAEDKAEQRVLERKKGAREERKAEREEEDLAKDQQWAQSRVEALRAEGRTVEADALEAAARDPKYATALKDAREAEAKRQEPLKPQIIDGQPYLPETDPQTGQITGYKKLPGVPAKAPATEEVIYAAALERLHSKGMVNPTAGQVATESVAIKRELAESGAPQIKIGTEERQLNISAEATEKMAGRLTGMLDEQTSGKTYTQYLGPGGGLGPFRLSGEERYALAERNGTVTPEQGELKSALAALQNRLNRALNGARASDYDIERVRAETPTLNDTPAVARKKFDMALENLRFLEEAAARNQGRPTRYEQQTGQRQSVLPAPKTADDYLKRKYQLAP